MQCWRDVEPTARRESMRASLRAEVVFVAWNAAFLRPIGDGLFWFCAGLLFGGDVYNLIGG
ncbi:hypothetical protein BDZ91DRAFT_745855 [Kalaharituber pfeilii]|nr:hypothetical protein BDZ91DRAFT_745855 [Kalaharituber pfeilii]